MGFTTNRQVHCPFQGNYGNGSTVKLAFFGADVAATGHDIGVVSSAIQVSMTARILQVPVFADVFWRRRADA